MRALVTGPDSTWVMADRETPTAGPSEVLVSVRAAGLNRADLLMREGSYVPDDASWNVPGDRVGFEMAGTVIEVGSQVQGPGAPAVGDRVMAQCGGACAEVVAVDHRLLLPVPARMSWVAAASLPSAVLTGFDALTGPGAMRPGERVLVTAAASGVGLTCVGLAARMGPAWVVGTTRDGRRAQAVHDAEADDVVVTDGTDAPWAAYRESGAGFDLVLDLVGGPGLEQVLPTMAPGGRLVQIGRLGGSHACVDLDLVASRRLTLVGTTFRGRGIEELADLTGRVKDSGVLGDLSTHVHDVFGFEDAEAAALSLAGGAGVGKVVVALTPPS